MCSPDNFVGVLHKESAKKQQTIRILLNILARFFHNKIHNSRQMTTFFKLRTKNLKKNKTQN
jgi:hypothetical protein